jgi:hypothetical protein
MLASPCAISSVLLSCFSPPPSMPSATTADSKLSMAASSAMVNAGGSSSCMVAKLGSARCGTGRLDGMASAPKRVPMVSMPVATPLASSPATSSVAATMATICGGTARAHAAG